MPKPIVQKQKCDRIKTTDLLSGKNEIIIVHNDEDYKLRITSNGKLILTK